jgi:hypothetical protein
MTDIIAERRSEESAADFRSWEFNALVIESVLLSGLLMAITWTMSSRSHVIPEVISFALGLLALGVTLVPIESVLLRRLKSRGSGIAGSILWVLGGVAVGATVYALLR